VVAVYPRYIAVSPVPERRVTIEAGRERTGVDFHARLEAAISGRVVDDQGAPLRGMRVVAVARQYNVAEGYSGMREYATGTLRYVAKETASTNSRGEFHLNRLWAGRPYRLLVHSLKQVVPHEAGLPDPPARGPAFRPTYYPSAATFEEATAVVLHSFERRSDLVIRMSPAPNRCLEGAATLAGTRARLGISIEEPDVARLAASRSLPAGYSTTDGSFRVCDLAPGAVSVRAGDGDRLAEFGASGATDVVVGERDVSGVTVDARLGVDVPIEIAWADPADRARGGIELAAVPKVPGLSGQRAFPTSFPARLSPWLRYSLEVGLPSPFYVREMSYDGASILAASLAPGRSFGAVRILVARDGGSLTTHVRAADGQPVEHTWVMLLPETARSESELAASMVFGLTGEDGRFVAPALRPGGYRVVATRIGPPALFNLPTGLPHVAWSPETMQLLLRARASAPQVSVSPGMSVETTVAPVVLK
jgi:hypothetical protein